MSEQTETPFNIDHPPLGPRGKGREGIAKWKLLLVGASLLLMVAGLGIRAYGRMQQGDTPQAQEAATGDAKFDTRVSQSGRSFLSNSASGVLPDDAPQAETKTEEKVQSFSQGLDAWSPAMFRMGFSFFVGFCIAYALRTFYRMIAFGAGLVLLVLFGLQYGGVITVNWDVAQQHYNSVVTWLGVQTEGLRQFVTAQLPSAALAGLGVVVGFKKG